VIKTDNKTTKYEMMCVTTRRSVSKKQTVETRLNCGKLQAVATLIYTSETQVMRDKDEGRTESSEMKFFRSVDRCTVPKEISN
jgi:hypothetical protein